MVDVRENRRLGYHIDVVDMQVTILRASSELGAIRREFTKPDFIRMIGECLD